MSYDLIVYLARSAMPAPTIWRDAIRDVGFTAELDSDFDVDSFSGFLPCPVKGELSGFEYHASAVTADQAGDLDLGSNVDFSIQFCIGSSPLELTSALAASSTLAKISGGVLHDPQEGESVLSTEAVAWAKSQLSQLSA